MPIPTVSRSDPRDATSGEYRGLGVLAVVAALVFLSIAIPVGTGVFLGMLVAFTIYPVHVALRRRTGRSNLSAFICAALAWAGLTGGVGGVFYLLIDQGIALARQLPTALAPDGALDRTANTVSEKLSAFGVHSEVLDHHLHHAAEEAASYAAGFARMAMSWTLSLTVTLFFTTVTVFCVLSRWARLAHWAEALLPLRPIHTQQLLLELRHLGREIMLGTVVVGLIQGADCTETNARSGGVSPFCWQVAPAQYFTTTGTFDIYVRNLTRYIDLTLSSVPNGGNPVVGPGQPESACHTQTSSGQVALNIYFMFLPNTGDATPDASFSYSLNVDLVGPLAPYNLTAGIGDQLLLLNWSSQIDPTIQGFNIYAEDQGTNGVAVGPEGGATAVTTPIYCHDNGATTCVDSGGAADDASSVDACTTTYSDASSYSEVLDASSYSGLSDADLASMGCIRSSPVEGVSTGQLNGPACTSSVLVDKFTSNVTLTTTEDGGISDVDGGVITPIVTSVDGAGATGLVGISEIDASAYGVGNVGGNTTSSFNVETLPSGMRLIDGHQYAIAVAAYDDDGNVGLLSNLVCQTPAPIVDFWDRYAVAGGTAGGGFCALQAPGVPVAGSMFGMGVGVAMVAFLRRRRRRNS